MEIEPNEDMAGDKADGGDAPLIDLNDASVKKLIARAKRRGVITYDELNEALPQDQMTSEQIEDIMSAISEMGVNIVESDEDAVDPEEKDVDEIDEPDGMAERPALEKKKPLHAASMTGRNRKCRGQVGAKGERRVLSFQCSITAPSGIPSLRSGRAAILRFSSNTCYQSKGR